MVSTAAMTAMPIMAPVSNDRRRSTGTGRVWALVNADLLWATAHVGCWAGSVAAAAAAGLQVRADQPFGEQTGGHRVDRLVQDVDHPTSPRGPGARRRRRGRRRQRRTTTADLTVRDHGCPAGWHLRPPCSG